MVHEYRDSREYIREVFRRQTDLSIANLEKIYQRVGDKIVAVVLTGTDFGAQKGPFISPKTYRDLYQPYHKKINDWIHNHTHWKTFMHSCGSIRASIKDFIEAGFDILNPVQCSAYSMNPSELKHEFGEQLTFWRRWN